MICITFDNFGCGADYGYGLGKMSPMLRPPSVPESEWDRYNEIGLSLGQPRILGLLSEVGIRTTFFAEGYSAVLHPKEMERWTDEGHEIGLHAWKHEMWYKIPDRETEDRLLTLAMAAMRETLGDKAPVGFRAPGFKLNQWSEELLEKHGIRYVSHVTEREKGFSDQFEKYGLTYPEAVGDVALKRLAFSPCSDSLTDSFLITPAEGGMFGTRDAIGGYDFAYDQAVEHQTKTPDEPWVIVAHPIFSGNRAWPGFNRFVRRLHERFGSDVFMTTGDVALAASPKREQRLGRNNGRRVME